jgi:subtilisin family serine protease
MTRRLALFGASALALAACSQDKPSPTGVRVPEAPALSQQVAPLLQSRAKERVPGQFIVVLQDYADGTTVSAAHAVSPRHVYASTIKGFAARLSDDQVERLRRDPMVKYIEPDGRTSIAQDRPTGRRAVPMVAPPAPAIVQPTPGGLWGLDRTDQQSTTNGTYTYTNMGSGVTVYIVDTGIRFTHNDFDGAALNRATSAIDIVNPGTPADDCHGHGTHVAGTVGGTTYGIAKAVKLKAVRVLDCFGNGLWSDFIAGADYITYNHPSRSVANASLGGGYVQAANDAVTKSILYGTVWVVAAGNSALDACGTSPAATPLAITVAASDAADNRAWFSNFGPCVDLYGPGVGVLSSWFTSDVATAVLDGTSMASPHVAGAAALFLQTKTTATPTEVRDVLVLNAQGGQIIGNPAGTPNLLLHKQTGVCNVAGAYCVGIDGNTQFPAFAIPFEWYYLSGTGIQRGYLRGTTGTNFDMELHEWNGAAWVLRVNSIAATTNPIITFNSTCAFGLGNCYKMYKVKSAAGGGVGSFDFWYDRQ